MQQIRSAPTSCANAPSADSTVYDTSQVSERPVPRSVPAIEYPALARRDKIQGTTVVTVVVDAAGQVEPSSVETTKPANALLDAEARRVVALATFWPACREGRAVRARIAVPFEFKAVDRAGTVFAVLAGVWAGIMAAVMH